MYYRLKSGYTLRGWDGMPWLLVKSPQNEAKRLKQEQFQVLTLCDGETELPNDLLNDNLKKVLRQCEREGWIEASKNRMPLEQEQYYQYYHNRFVGRVFWSITGRCNYRCRHCYMDAPDAALGELSTRQAFDLIDQMKECGVLCVDITGGEPLVRKDFLQLVDRILSHKMVIRQIYTNGWMLNERMLEEFERRGFKPEINISFDGVGWHDWMRGVPGAEEAALRAIKLSVERGFMVSIGMCLHKGNLQCLPDTVKLLDTLGVKHIKVVNVDETDLWRCHSEGKAMTRQEYVEALIPYIEWYYKEGRPFDHLVLGGVADLRRDQPARPSVGFYNYQETDKILNTYMCEAARSTCYITPEGRLLPCMPMTSSPYQKYFPLVQDIGLREGLSGSAYMQFVNGRIRDLFAVNVECNACAYRYKCGGGCRASALAGPDKNLMGCDREMCAFWKNGYEERILQAIQEAEAKYGVSTGA